MAEKKVLIERQRMDYEGIFDVKKLFLEIDQWIMEHGYDRMEFKNFEQVTETGREVQIELRPWKKFSDYAKSELRIEIEMKHIRDVEIDNDGVKTKLQRGKIRFTFQANLITDYENKWEGTPMYQFIRTFVDKFIRKTQHQNFEQECTGDCKQLQDELKAFLNLFRYQA